MHPSKNTDIGRVHWSSQGFATTLSVQAACSMDPVVKDPQLPSFYELLHRFSLFDSSASSRCDVQIGSNGSVFCHCQGCVGWRDFVEGRDPSDAHVKYEVFTREHVSGLACYLRTRAAEYNLSVMKVLEVGAGSGRLSQHLNRCLSRLFNENQGPVVRVIATDSGARGLNGPAVKVEDAVHAITRRKPHIIISSWMPRGVDWTAHMRAEQSVCEYILIGETDNGICGCPRQTWGSSWTWGCWDDTDDSDDSENSNPQADANALDRSSETRQDAFQIEPLERLPILPSTGNQQSEIPSVSSSCYMNDSIASDMAEENQGSCSRRTPIERPQYERDGWERVELDSLSKLQLCRTDERWSTSHHSHTVSFRKK